MNASSGGHAQPDATEQDSELALDLGQLIHPSTQQDRFHPAKGHMNRCKHKHKQCHIAVSVAVHATARTCSAPPTKLSIVLARGVRPGRTTEVAIHVAASSPVTTCTWTRGSRPLRAAAARVNGASTDCGTDTHREAGFVSASTAAQHNAVPLAQAV